MSERDEFVTYRFLFWAWLLYCLFGPLARLAADAIADGLGAPPSDRARISRLEADHAQHFPDCHALDVPK